jgi:hypothetical protein
MTIFVAAATLLLAAAPVSEVETARAEILAVIETRLEATRRNDSAAFMARVPADFRIEGRNGAITTREMLAARVAARAQAAPQTVSLTVMIDRIDLRGDDATIWTSQRWERLAVRPGETAPSRIVSTQSHEEHWRRRDGRWEGYLIRELGGSMTVNGVAQ